MQKLSVIHMVGVYCKLVGRHTQPIWELSPRLHRLYSGIIRPMAIAMGL